MEMPIKTSPMPWRKDELNNVYDANGMLIFTPRAHNDEVGVMPENDGNADLVVWMTEVLISDGMGWL